MGVLTRAAFLKQIQCPTLRKVQTPELSGIECVYIRQLGADDFPELQSIAERHKKNQGKLNEVDMLAEWCVFGLCDAKGKRLFQKKDAKVLAKAPMALLGRCAMAFMEANGMSEDADVDRKKK